MDDRFESRFFRQSDPKRKEFIFTLPPAWWSRCYEYPWASMFAEPGDTVLDAGCGISHPFKFFLSDTCREVHACDIDERILSSTAILQEIEADFGQEEVTKFPLRYFDNIHFAKADLAKLPYEKGKFDKIFCISVLEHLNMKVMLSILKEFKRTLKDTGLIILTFDYPTINLDTFINIITEVGLKFNGPVSLTLPEDAVFSDLYGRLYCYRAVLRKD
ncbi:class I SAM-dependent methyltransferase [Carboxydocella sp. JDF658]|uniref:class I SAM-dependent methyltransferase n=1 Tax=Carboxydocella sp. JDF658 TaxID=1926600 RepID=UPI0009AC0DE0|nr:class I SAM-dependent methyltransferase [Carboxydocella sp. JDF658]GAW31225.1 hypothetical protein JDF658_09900 [Carboxydocella sp. JDF658]